MLDLKNMTNFTINPFEEAVAYETLLALKDSSEIELEKEFPSKQISLEKQNSLVQILNIKRSNGAQAEIDSIYPVIERFLNELTPFFVCTQDDFHYHSKFKDALHPLKLFYYKGDINLLEKPCISIVGSRQASQKSLLQTSKLAKILVENKFTIVSGLAKGIDTAALTTAIENNGQVIAVIGTPINQYYPYENKILQDKIARDHLLISHVPFYRYKEESFNSRRFYFPKRNITMSAISKATVIVEASETSGTYSQAKAAIRQGRKLFIMQQAFKDGKWPTKFEKLNAIKIKDENHLLEALKTMGQ